MMARTVRCGLLREAYVCFKNMTKTFLLFAAFLMGFMVEAQTIIIHSRLDGTAGINKYSKWFWEFVIHDGDNEPIVEGHYVYNDHEDALRFTKDLTMLLNRYYDKGYKLKAVKEDDFYILQAD